MKWKFKGIIDDDLDEIRDWQTAGKPIIRPETEEEVEERLEVTLSRNRNKINKAR